MGEGVQEIGGKEIGIITHYFDHISVAVIKLTKGGVKVGDKIHIKGHTTDFEQSIKSMQVEHKDIKEAKKGHEIGLKVAEPVKEHDVVFKL